MTNENMELNENQEQEVALNIATELEVTIQQVETTIEEHTAELVEETPQAEDVVVETAPETAIEEFEVVENIIENVDYEHFTKSEFVNLLKKNLEVAKSDNHKPSDFKRIDETLKKVKPLFEQMKRAEREVARQAYIAANENDEGFEYKVDTETAEFEQLYREIKDIKGKFFQELDNRKDKNFAVKAELLQKLRELVEVEEKSEKSQEKVWNEFKKIQDDWKNAGNIVSPHNTTLWATYNALVDMFYSNRNIYFELKDLDRKKNASLKADIIVKIEALSQRLESEPLTNKLLDEVNHLFEEYKHIGPAPKAEQEVLWERLKMAMDTVYDARRAKSGEEKQKMTEVYNEKSKIYETLVPLTVFTSTSINEWNDKSREVTALKEQWNAIKAPMLRIEGSELTSKFWTAFKTFFQNKGEFFKEVDAKREQNLNEKTALCEEAEAILAAGEDNQASTEAIINLQKKWKTIGAVSDKVKEKIYKRFRTACDAYFDLKRDKTKAVDAEYEVNLTKKQDICSRLEAASGFGETSLKTLNEFKSEWNAAGFVPRKDMQAIQKRYVDAVNGYVSSMGKLSSKEKADMLLANEVEFSKSSPDSSRGLQRKEGDIRRKITLLEDDLNVWKNNIEFFARSKNSDKLRADFEKKIAASQKQLDELKQQLKIVVNG